MDDSELINIMNRPTSEERNESNLRNSQSYEDMSSILDSKYTKDDHSHIRNTTNEDEIQIEI